MKQNIKTESKDIVNLIVETLNLHFIERDSIQPETPLWSDQGLGLDSVDLLEVVVAVEQRYGVKIKNAEEGKVHFQSVESICHFIDAHSEPTSIAAIRPC